MPKIYMSTDENSNNAQSPIISSSYEEFEPEHEADDFIITANGTLTGYRGIRNHVVIPGKVFRIGEGAFQGKFIKSVTLPKSVVYVGKRAFYGCRSLTSIFFEENKACFVGVIGGLKSTVYLSELEIDEEAFALAPKSGTQRCILLPRHLKKIAPNAFTNAGENDILFHAPLYCLKSILLSEKDFPHLHPYFDDDDIDAYIADYAEHKAEKVNTRIAPFTRQIREIQRGQLAEAVRWKNYYERMLLQKTGFFQASERKNCKKRIAEYDEEIARANKKIQALEADIAIISKECEQDKVQWNALSKAEQRILAKEEMQKNFHQFVRSERDGFLFCQRYKKDYDRLFSPEPPQDTAMAQSATTQAAASHAPLPSSPVYEGNDGKTFTGNQTEDYGKLREKILSGEVSTSELREFETKWGYLP